MSDTKTNVANGWQGIIKGMPAKGAVAERKKSVSMRDIELFTEITGDRNPVHYDRALAESTVFGGLICQGGVTSGILNAVVAEDLPGTGNGLPRRRVEVRQSRLCRRRNHRTGRSHVRA